MDKKIVLFSKLTFTYITLLVICYLIYSFALFPSNPSETITAITGLLGWSATLFAPIAAYLLLYSWKEQARYTEKLKILASMLAEIVNISNNINELRSNENIAMHIAYIYKNFEPSPAKDLLRISIEIKKHGEKHPYPKNDSLYINYNNLINLYLQLNLYCYKNQKNDTNKILTSINNSKALIKNLKDEISHLYINENNNYDTTDEDYFKNWLESASLSNTYISEFLKIKHPNIGNIKFMNLIKSIDSIRDNIMEYRDKHLN